MRTALVFFAPLVAAAALASQSKFSVLPKENQHLEGNAANFQPMSSTNARFQSIIHASHIAIPSSSVITAAGFRNEGQQLSIFPKKTLIWEIRISESSTIDGNNYTVNFDSNHTTPPTTVFGGRVEVGPFISGQTMTLGTPVLVKFSQPYAYRGGNVIFELIAIDPFHINGSASYNVDHTIGSTTSGLASNLGVGCPVGKNSVSTGGSTAALVPGGSLPVNLTRASKPGTAAINLIGTSLSNWGAIKLPLEYVEGCWILTDLLAAASASVDSSGRATVTWPIPQDAGLIGLVINAQWYVSHVEANPTGFTSTDIGQYLIHSTPDHPINAGMHYWSGDGVAASQATSTGSPLRGRLNVLVFEHN